jgi:hypothetical protein
MTSRIGICGFSFWRISAQCWLIDEDCHFGPEPGRRREGIMFGALNMIQNFSGAFLSSAVFIGLGIAGLQTKNCNAFCEPTSEGSTASCVDTCFTDVINSQPDSLISFVRTIIGFWAPFCELMVAFHAWYFPIKGARLRKLNNVIRQSRGENIASDDVVVAIPRSRRGQVDLMAAHQATSKMAVNLGEHHHNDCEDSAAKLSHIISFMQGRQGPKSTAVFFEWGDTRSRSHSFDAPSGAQTECASVPASKVPVSGELDSLDTTTGVQRMETLRSNAVQEACEIHVDLEAEAGATEVHI